MSVEEQSATTPIRVGIDLGTSRSAISSSIGGQFVVDSFVGWPTDLVARKVLKRDLVIGRDALDNRTMLDLHRPLERGLIKEGSERDLQAAEPAEGVQDRRPFGGMGIRRRHEHARLAQRLISSLDQEKDADAERLWLAEAERRLADLKS